MRRLSLPTCLDAVQLLVEPRSCRPACRSIAGPKTRRGGSKVGGRRSSHRLLWPRRGRNPNHCVGGRHCSVCASKPDSSLSQNHQLRVRVRKQGVVTCERCTTSRAMGNANHRCPTIRLRHGITRMCGCNKASARFRRTYTYYLSSPSFETTNKHVATFAARASGQGTMPHRAPPPAPPAWSPSRRGRALAHAVDATDDLEADLLTLTTFLQQAVSADYERQQQRVARGRGRLHGESR